MQDHGPQREIPRQRHPLVALALPVIGGIATDQYADLELWLWLVVALVAGLLAWSAAAVRITSVFWRRTATLMLLIGVFALAGCWHHIRWNLFARDEIGLRALPEFQPTCLQAVALESPMLLFHDDTDPLSTLPQQESAIFSVSVSAIRAGSTWQTASGFVEVRVAGHVWGIGPGDTLQIYGKLRRPLDSMNPGAFSDFEYQRSRRRLSRLSVNYPEAIEVLEKASGWNPKWWIARLRQQGNQLLQEYLPQRNADLAAALLLGDKQRIAQDRADAFMRTGTVHLLAISGLHVGILVFGFYLIARVLLIPPRAALVCILVLATTYAFMSGCRAPVVRATILVYVFCLGSILRRQSFGFNSLAAAALIVLVINPHELFHAARSYRLSRWRR